MMQREIRKPRIFSSLFFVSSVIRLLQLMGLSSTFQIQYIVPKKVVKEQMVTIGTYKQVRNSVRVYIIFVNRLQHNLRALVFFEMLEKRKTAGERCCNPQSPEMDQACKQCDP